MKTKPAYQRIAVMGASLLVAASASAAEPTNPIVYQYGSQVPPGPTGLFRDVTDTRGLAAGSTVLGLGNEIALAGSQRQLTDLRFDYFLSASSGNETAQVSLFDRSGPGLSPGTTPFYTSPLVSLSALGAGAHSGNVNGISGFTLPDNFYYTVSFNGIDGGEQAGLQFYDANSGF